MTTASQVLDYLKVLVWPIIVAIALVLFREPIKGILGGIEEFEGFGIKAKIRSQVTRAATDSSNALAASPVSKVKDPPLGIIFVIAPAMQAALRFSPSLVRRVSLPAADPLQRMRTAFERLNTAITAVLVATIVPTSDEEQRVVNWTRGRPRDSTPAGIEIYMIDLTGYSGWEGVIETRDILRGNLDSICGKSAKVLTPTEAQAFESAALAALEQLRRLVDAVANLSRG